MCAKPLQSCLTVTPWTVARQGLVSMGFSNKDAGAGCCFLLQGIHLTRDRTCVSSASCWGLLLCLISSPLHVLFLGLKHLLQQSSPIHPTALPTCSLHILTCGLPSETSPPPQGCDLPRLCSPLARMRRSTTSSITLS